MAEAITKDKLEQVIIAMIASSRNLTLYPADHPVVTGAVRKLLSDFQALLEGRDKLSLAIVEEVLVFEGHPFYQPNIAVREFQRRIEERGVTAVEFYHDLGADELMAWAQFLLEDAEKFREHGASAYLEQKKIVHIRVRGCAGGV